MKRVLLISNYAWTVFNFRRNLIRELVRNKHDVYVQTEFDGYQSRLGLQSDHVLPLIIQRKGTNPFQDARTLASIRREMVRLRPDICLLFTIKPVIYGGMAAALTSTPFICNITGLGAAFDAAMPIRVLVKSMYRTVLARAAHVFFQNSDDFQQFSSARLVPPSRASVLPGSGVDLNRFRLTEYPANKAPILLLVARLLWAKGVGEFVEVARRIKSRRPDVRFQLLGPTGVQNPSAIAPAQIQRWTEEGHIEYLGETDDPYPYISSADCVVLPSYYREGIPRALLEAAAVGRPIITTDNIGCREAVEHGVTGYLCRPRDVDDLQAAVENFLALPRSQRAAMGRSGRRKMEQQFDEHLVLGRYLAEIEAATR